MQVGIIGAGPAGMMAALALIETNHEVTLIDEQSMGGGQIYRHAAQMASQDARIFGSDYAAGGDLVRRFHAVADNERLTHRKCCGIN